MPTSAYSSLVRQLQGWNFAPLAVLMYVDLRQTRQINRMADPRQTDNLLESVARTLADWAGKDGVSGRLWSNEFIAARAIDHAQSSVEDAENLRDRLTQLHFESAIGQNEIGVSIGVTTTGLGCDWASVIDRAGAACVASKARGFNQIVLHGNGGERQAAPAYDAALVGGFRRLLHANQLGLHLQPIMHVRSGKLRKAEFLLRAEQNGVWRTLPPGTIETMEYFGLSAELDRFSCNFALDWLQENADVFEQLHGISLNLSGHSLLDGRFMDRLYREVRGARLPPGGLCFEITETAAIQHLDLAAEIIGAFRQIGCKFSLDDFGSGLCSFGYLQTLPVDEIKIDGRFVRDLAHNATAVEIVRAIHCVAHATGKITVAEFVDAPEKLAALENIGVDYAQGWLFNPALAPEEFLKLLD